MELNRQEIETLYLLADMWINEHGGRGIYLEGHDISSEATHEQRVEFLSRRQRIVNLYDRARAGA